jgi:hypothetical protein
VISTEKTRGYIYRILLGLQPLAVAVAIVESDLRILWIGVGSAVIGNGLASYYTSTGRGRIRPRSGPDDLQGAA